MKYIDADRLRAELIDRVKLFKELSLETINPIRIDECEKIIGIIDSLQQEQPKPSGYDKALLEVKSKVDELYEEASIGLSEYDSGLYNGIAETCMKLRGFIKARLDSDEQPDLPGIKESGIPGKDYIPVEWVDACEMYGKWKIVKQEQPEVDLDADIEMEWDSFNKHLAEYGGKSEEVVWLNRYNFNEIAHYFWNKGYNPRKEG